MSSITRKAIVQICSSHFSTSGHRLPWSRSDNAIVADSLFRHNLPPISLSSSVKIFWKCWSTATRGSLRRTRQILVMPSLILGLGSYWYLQVSIRSSEDENLTLGMWLVKVGLSAQLIRSYLLFKVNTCNTAFGRMFETVIRWLGSLRSCDEVQHVKQI